LQYPKTRHIADGYSVKKTFHSDPVELKMDVQTNNMVSANVCTTKSYQVSYILVLDCLLVTWISCFHATFMLLSRHGLKFWNLLTPYKKSHINFLCTPPHITVRKYQHYLHESGLLGSEKQWLWEFTCCRSEMLKHSSEKLNFISKKKRNERQSRRKSKVFPLPFIIFPSRSDFLIKILSQYRCR
jgi:hypothetical protein